MSDHSSQQGDGSPDQTPTRAWLRPTMDVLLIIVGAGLNALAVNVLLVPNEIVAGGFLGLAVMGEIQLNIPVGWTLLAINAPLVWLQWRFLGGVGSVLRTILGVVSLSVLTAVTRDWVGPITDDRLLVVVYGGVLGGIGLALVFLGRGTTGGGDILSRLCFRFFGWGFGRTMLGVNILVYGLAGILFGMEPVMLALLMSYVMSQTLDSVLHGMNSSRVAFIVSRHPHQVSQRVARELGRGVTKLQGEGGHTGQNVGFLYIVVPRSGLQRMKRVVLDSDPDAFITVMSPRESVGGYQSTVPL